MCELDTKALEYEHCKKDDQTMEMGNVIEAEADASCTVSASITYFLLQTRDKITLHP